MENIMVVSVNTENNEDYPVERKGLLQDIMNTACLFILKTELYEWIKDVLNNKIRYQTIQTIQTVPKYTDSITFSVSPKENNQLYWYIHYGDINIGIVYLDNIVVHSMYRYMNINSNSISRKEEHFSFKAVYKYWLLKQIKQ